MNEQNEKGLTPAPVVFTQSGPIGPNGPVDSAGNPLAPQTPVIGGAGPGTPPGNIPYVTPTYPIVGFIGGLSSTAMLAATTS